MKKRDIRMLEASHECWGSCAPISYPMRPYLPYNHEVSLREPYISSHASRQDACGDNSVGPYSVGVVACGRRWSIDGRSCCTLVCTIRLQRVACCVDKTAASVFGICSTTRSNRRPLLPFFQLTWLAFRGGSHELNRLLGLLQPASQNHADTFAQHSLHVFITMSPVYHGSYGSQNVLHGHCDRTSTSQRAHTLLAHEPGMTSFVACRYTFNTALYPAKNI